MRAAGARCIMWSACLAGGIGTVAISYKMCKLTYKNPSRLGDHLCEIDNNDK